MSEVTELIEALKGGDVSVRRKTAEKLGLIKDPRAVEPLIAALGDVHEYVRRAAAWSLLAINSDWRDSTEAKLQVSELILSLKDEDENAHFAAARALGEIKDPRSIEPLITALLDDKYKPVRSAAAHALGRIKDPRAVGPLIAILKDENEYVRSEAVWALGEIQDPQATQPLIATLGDVNEGVRSAAADSLGKIKDPQAVEPLIAVLKDEDKDVRSVAVWALDVINPDWGDLL
jgi:HEAT repeat protein